MFKQLSLALCVLTTVLAGCSPDTAETAQAPAAQASDSVETLHQRLLTMDTHVDLDVSNFTRKQNYTQDLKTQVDLAKLARGGLDAIWFSIYTAQGELTEAGYAAALDNAIAKFDAVHRLVEEIAPDRIGLATTPEQVRALVAEGKLVALMGVENAYPLGTDLSLVQDFYNRGARYMSLAHNGHSQFADSNTGESDGQWLYGGLSDLGRDLVKEMNRVGIIIDLSHPSKAANLETLRLSKAPVIASHSSARALNDVSRNLDDEELLAIQENGGVVQTVAFASYLNTGKYNAWQEKAAAVMAREAQKTGFNILAWPQVGKLDSEARREYMAGYRELRAKVAPLLKQEVDPVAPPVNVQDFVDHIDYLVQKIGIDHVGISSDFDGGGGVSGWNDASETLAVTRELLQRNYSETDITLLWGGNLMRVMDEVQAVAATLNSTEDSGEESEAQIVQQ
ncbi:membrane dipeptidase [Aestuariicella hydrocarbonica]|uniref:Membrane dipeptidase n=1 Tax=Pseudomaricurvus hydrocarbonicus TaxID=1470433 RepID=A0A9E5MHN5_9GAMM|nr:dipeptidase [Aestuariicella hydrocarbonica]NHO66171.1 membrane dipeptidase [Aestuariicella hydrocarbonica]